MIFEVPLVYAYGFSKVSTWLKPL